MSSTNAQSEARVRIQANRKTLMLRLVFEEDGDEVAVSDMTQEQALRLATGIIDALGSMGSTEQKS